MAREFQISSKEVGGPANTRSADQQHEQPPRHDFGALDESYFPQLPLAMPNIGQSNFSTAQYSHDLGGQGGADLFYPQSAFGPPGASDFLNDQEWDISQNTLYGLFAPLHP